MAKKWSEATEEEKKKIVNGFGPIWLPAKIRNQLTTMASWFFDEADWGHHDWGYYWGEPSRATCDRKFLSAMLRDASKQETVMLIYIATVLAWSIWVIVRLFGWLSYGKSKKRKNLESK